MLPALPQDSSSDSRTDVGSSNLPGTSALGNGILFSVLNSTHQTIRKKKPGASKMAQEMESLLLPTTHVRPEDCKFHKVVLCPLQASHSRHRCTETIEKLKLVTKCNVKQNRNNIEKKLKGTDLSTKKFPIPNSLTSNLTFHDKLLVNKRRQRHTNTITDTKNNK